MTKNLFKEVAMNETNPNYSKAISRLEPLYQRSNDLRSEFGRDYTRIIFSQAYRRLKHKTQVFFAVKDDHVCTRSEHVNLVESVSYTINWRIIFFFNIFIQTFINNFCYFKIIIFNYLSKCRR